ncbi:hypothetical protein F4780DRAFT_753283 [Xylariomycetidae sp. FL0641]|nr:hypothetical protein F4780DRAFT_753283 [Xylariomycetidae sp. FL0641]
MPAAALPSADSAPSSAAAEYVRLHITPLDQSLLSVVVPSSVLPRARNISYHTIETFPERRYGFVDLPTADAEKLKKKLNGAVLKGTKMRIDKARPEAIPEPTGDHIDTPKSKKEKKDKKKSKKRKREEGVIDGVELRDRKVKRGWTTTEKELIDEKRKAKKDKKAKDGKKEKQDKKDKKDKKKRDAKSKYTDAPECLFKTKLPAASPPKESEDAASHKKRKRKSDHEVVVHEFEKTVKVPSFLKATAATATSEAVKFEDGVGWVDDKGNVVEPARPSKRSTVAATTKPKKVKTPEPAPAAMEEDDDETSSSGTSSSSEDEPASDEEGESADEQVEKATPAKKLKVDTQALSSPSSLPASAAKLDSGRPKSSGSVTSLTIKIPPATPGKVHPLEALYKRPAGGVQTPGGSKEAEPFSFFGGAGDDDDDVEEEGKTEHPGPMPMTPFTKQDFDFRNIRSAAPTPDTAHPSRSFNFWAGNAVGVAEEEEDDDEDEEQAEEDMDEEDITMANTRAASGSTTEAKQTPVSDFQKQFWEKRGDLNRAWRKRRKTASKEKRYRENRARAERAI